MSDIVARLDAAAEQALRIRDDLRIRPGQYLDLILAYENYARHLREFAAEAEAAIYAATFPLSRRIEDLEKERDDAVAETERQARYLDEIAGLVEKNPLKSGIVGAVQLVIKDWRADATPPPAEPG